MVRPPKEGQLWREVDAELLIEQYRARPALWDKSSEEYIKSKEAVKKRMREDITRTLAAQNPRITSKDVTAKWARLLSEARAHKRKSASHPSGSAATVRVTNPWFYQLIH